MPATLRKLKNGKVRVRTPGGVKAKATTPARAKAQQRLLHAIEFNPKFVPKPGSKIGGHSRTKSRKR
jgi:hypothetical protein